MSEVGKNLDILYNKVTDKVERLFKVDMNLSDLMDYDDYKFDTTETYRINLLKSKPTVPKLMKLLFLTYL